MNTAIAVTELLPSQEAEFPRRVSDPSIARRFDAVPPFLRLPRELRDEIYKYLLPLAPREAHVGMWYPSAHYPTEPSFKLAILRVNKQIHDEASAVLYGCSTFVFWINIKKRQTYANNDTSRDPKTCFDGNFNAPWERLAFTRREDTVGAYRGYDPRTRELPPQIEESDAKIQPAPRYRALLRHVRVSVRDFCTSPDNRTISPLSDIAREKMRRVLLPIAYRMQTSFGDAGSKLNMTIELRPRIYKHGRLTLPVRLDEDVDVGLYQEIIEMVWPLTTGPWQWRLKIPNELLALFPNAAEKILERCTQLTVITDAEKQSYSSIRPQCSSFWSMPKGELVTFRDTITRFANRSPVMGTCYGTGFAAGGLDGVLITPYLGDISRASATPSLVSDKTITPHTSPRVVEPTRGTPAFLCPPPLPPPPPAQSRRRRPPPWKAPQKRKRSPPPPSRKPAPKSSAPRSKRRKLSSPSPSSPSQQDPPKPTTEDVKGYAVEFEPAEAFERMLARQRGLEPRPRSAQKQAQDAMRIRKKNSAKKPRKGVHKCPAPNCTDPKPTWSNRRNFHDHLGEHGIKVWECSFCGSTHARSDSVYVHLKTTCAHNVRDAIRRKQSALSGDGGGGAECVALAFGPGLPAPSEWTQLLEDPPRPYFESCSQDLTYT
ncbi:hypothetical protein Dda_8277 [Drechslerella dactyloides]|uniref:Uncharacterized protein n=1 Tax=Drechslerella dactyloides TaxID=74499 RepID=A0AAD6IRP3_DREDA|nr:hypothetical protein Dda_8277 [Drechslerella dactyloides]